jgi:hypothetical protein
MDNELLNELWQTRRKIEGKKGSDINKFLNKLRQRSDQKPSNYYFGKPILLSKQKTA